VKRGRELLDEIELSDCPTPALWWLGDAGFAVKHRQAICYIDPYLTGRDPLFWPGDVRHASLILCTHAQS